MIRSRNTGNMFSNKMIWRQAPHGKEVGPFSVACNPRDARVNSPVSPADDQPPPRQEGEAVLTPRAIQVRDRAGIRARAGIIARGRAREQLSVWEQVGADIIIPSANHHLPCNYKGQLLSSSLRCSISLLT